MPVVNYVWDPTEDNIMAEYDDQGGLIARYTTEPEVFGNVISQYRDGQTSYFHHDGSGNTTEVTNDNGDVTDTRAYTAFGEITESTGSTEFPFQFVGQKGYYRDEETGEYSVRARPYEPVITRWTTADPIGLGRWRTNVYGYSRTNPINRVDPSGLLDYEIKFKDLSACGKFRWIINWKLGAIKEPGFIVQHVNYYVKECPCSGCDGDDCNHANKDCSQQKSPGSYDEIWVVAKSEGVYRVYNEYCKDWKDHKMNHDTFCFDGLAPDRNNKGTCGSVWITGFAFFVPVESLKAADVKLDDYGFGKEPTAGCLLSKNLNAEGLGNSPLEKFKKGNTVFRELEVFFDCCPDTCGTNYLLTSRIDPNEAFKNEEKFFHCFTPENASGCPPGGFTCGCSGKKLPVEFFN